MRRLYESEHFIGLSPKMLPKEATAFRDGYNVLFDGEFMRTVDKVEALNGIRAINTSTQDLSVQRHLVIGHAGKRIIYVQNLQGDSITSPFQKVVAGETLDGTVYETIIWGKWAIAVARISGSDAIKLWVLKPSDGPNPQGFKPFSSDPANSQEITLPLDAEVSHNQYILQIFGNYILLAHGNKIAWCDFGNPEVWRTNNVLELRDIHTNITAMRQQGAVMMVYTEDRIGALEFIGGTLVFRYTPRLSAGGASGKNAIVDVGQNHFGHSSDGFFMSSGFSYELIDDVRIRDEVSGVPSSCVHREKTNEVIWFFETKGVVYNYKFKTWSIMKYPHDVTGAIRIDRAYILSNGLFYPEGRIDDWRAETADIDCQTTRSYKCLQAVEVTYDGRALLDIYKSEKGSPSEDLRLDQPDTDWKQVGNTITLDENDPDLRDYIYLPTTYGMFFRLVFRGNQDFRLAKFKLWGQYGGKF